MEEILLVVLVSGTTGFFASFAAIKVLPKFLRSPTTGGKFLRLLLSIVIAFAAFFLLYYAANFPLLEATIKAAVGVAITITGAFVCIYLDRDKSNGSA